MKRWSLALIALLAMPAKAQETVFRIPNLADAFAADQAEVDAKDLEILIAGVGGTGVISGASVQAQGSPDMTVAVASGTIRVGTTIVAVSSGNVTITTAHSTLPRFDLVVVSNAGTKSVAAGTASANPVFPTIPASSVVLASVYVPAADTSIQNNQIIGKQVILASLLSPGLTVEVVTTTKTTTAGESGELYTNTGDADGSTLTLMNDPTLGAYWSFAVDAAQTQTIAPSAGETLYFGSSTCGTSITSNTPGSTLSIAVTVGGSGGKYMVTKAIGTWTCT